MSLIEFILFSFIPTVLILLIIPIWEIKKVRKISNDSFQVIASILYFGMWGLTWYISSIFFLSLVPLLFNLPCYLWFNKHIKNNRCPHCRAVALELLKRKYDRTDLKETTYTYRQYGEVVDKSIVTEYEDQTTYYLKCRNCGRDVIWKTDKGTHYDRENHIPKHRW